MDGNCCCSTATAEFDRDNVVVVALLIKISITVARIVAVGAAAVFAAAEGLNVGYVAAPVVAGVGVCFYCCF